MRDDGDVHGTLRRGTGACTPQPVTGERSQVSVTENFRARINNVARPRARGSRREEICATGSRVVNLGRSVFNPRGFFFFLQIRRCKTFR